MDVRLSHRLEQSRGIWLKDIEWRCPRSWPRGARDDLAATSHYGGLVMASQRPPVSRPTKRHVARVPAPRVIVENVNHPGSQRSVDAPVRSDAARAPQGPAGPGARTDARERPPLCRHSLSSRTRSSLLARTRGGGCRRVKLNLEGPRASSSASSTNPLRVHRLLRAACCGARPRDTRRPSGRGAETPRTLPTPDS